MRERASEAISPAIRAMASLGGAGGDGLGLGVSGLD